MKPVLVALELPWPPCTAKQLWLLLLLLLLGRYVQWTNPTLKNSIRQIRPTLKCVTTHNSQMCYNTQNQPGNRAKTSARQKGEHAAPSSPDSKSTKPTSTLLCTTVVRGPGQAGPEACPTRPSQHPNRRPIQEMITPHQPNTQFAQGTLSRLTYIIRLDSPTIIPYNVYYTACQPYNYIV
jgi:hypothetical protein